jgi:hypothetical protein
MSLIDQKAKVFGNIAAARTLSEGLPKLKTNPSFPSINNDGNSIAFLTDMLKSLVGIEKLRDVIVDSLAFKLDEMEIQVKNSMKSSLNELVNCGIDPSIPAYIKSSGSGILTEVNKVDFFDILKVDPISPTGRLIYSDTYTSPLTNSSDFNAFLYGTIQNESVTETWSTLQPILNVRFDSANISPTPNNTFKFNANASFDNKSLTELNNTFIDSIDLFESKGLLTKLIDDLFGTISFSINKTQTQIQKEEEIKNIINCIINADENDVIDDSYFTFSNEEIAIQEEAARWRKKGVRPIKSCLNTPIKITPQDMTYLIEPISGTTGQDKKVAVANAVNTLGTIISNQATTAKNSYALELNFIENLIESIVTAIVSLILSPKVVSIFLINYKIVYGPTEDYDDAKDFMRQNKNLMKEIAKSVRNAIIGVLLNSVLKEISTLVAATAVEIATEKAKNQLAQILSLVGVPQDVIRLIKGL